jgi:hypothetical protein
MSTVTSFTSPAETCTVHVLHGEGRNESKGAEGLLGEALVISDGQRWRWFQAAAVLVAAEGFFPPVFPYFSLYFFFFFFSVLTSFLPFRVFFFFFLSFGLSNLPSSALSLSSFSLLFSGLFFSCPLPLSLFFFFFFYSFVSLFFFVRFGPIFSSLLFSFSPLLCSFFLLPLCFYRQK